MKINGVDKKQEYQNFETMIRHKMTTVLLGTALLLAGCSAEKAKQGTTGTMAVRVETEDSAIEISRASLGLTLPSSDEFSLTVSNSSGEVGTWSTLASYDESTPYEAGSYTAQVTYGSTATEAFETPCFTGSKAFNIVAEQLTQVSIPASIANAVVTIDCTDNFKNYFPDYEFALATTAGNSIPFVKGESRRAFIAPATFTVTGTAKTQTGTEVPISKTFNGISAKTLYKVLFDVNSGNIGGATITISFNDQPVAEIPIDIELNE